MSNWLSTRRIATIRCPSASIASHAIRVARSRNSSLYFFGAATLRILPGIRACTEPGAHQVVELLDIVAEGSDDEAVDAFEKLTAELSGSQSAELVSSLRNL